MTRHLIFKHSDNQYVLFENEQIVFSINDQDLLFNSLQFYQGIYADKSKTSMISLKDELDAADRTGRYVFQWLSHIMGKISEALGENVEEIDAETSVINIPHNNQKKIIPYFDLPVCAGNGLFTDSPSSTEIEVDCLEADYAVMVSGHSMEPLYQDSDILLVKKQETPNNGDVVIINVNGDSFCRKYCCDNNREIFCAVNEGPQYTDIIGSVDAPVTIQGIVLGTFSTNS